MKVKINEEWQSKLQPEFDKEYFRELVTFVKNEYAANTICPPGNMIFNAFDKCLFSDLKVVILGQDPYHGPGQAHGLCFSVNDGIDKPPSLKNIFKEQKTDLGIEIPESGNLERWAEQGVMLLNATLTVRIHEAGSHQKKGWETFTDSVIKLISDEKENVVFLLWGRYARNKISLIDQDKHFILESAHPSPLSAYNGFWDCKHFSKTNSYLSSKGMSEIDW